MSLHKETTSSKFKVGDKVVITNDSSWHNLYVGNCYTLSQKSSSSFGDNCWIIVAGGVNRYIIEDDFCKLEEAPQSGPYKITIADKPQKEVSPTNNPQKIKSDGKDSAYYNFPTDCTTLNDLIEYKNMSFAHGNIFKAAYRLGHKDGISLEYDLNKIIYYAERMLKQLKGK
ncbi:hypothetical protein UFOVP59_7 [uncultured Caudovirales phage]|uniref:Uncharacterized protein n=1 Tax=uncultured Caudovirales phage TaxID=2100421 RepID=A0A6J5KU53_9CAUD|nr:hypothetical protein UFOVP59_7 [uncultured Caudovirales phage]CAB5220696.1 hypothetical protein UFOVP246_25 [uncultured Caudovirales phage]